MRQAGNPQRCLLVRDNVIQVGNTAELPQTADEILWTGHIVLPV